MAEPSTQGKGKSHKFDEEGTEQSRVPWHFWLLAIGVLVYLGWRLVQLIMWIF